MIFEFTLRSHFNLSFLDLQKYLSLLNVLILQRTYLKRSIKLKKQQLILEIIHKSDKISNSEDPSMYAMFYSKVPAVKTYKVKNIIIKVHDSCFYTIF